MKYIILILLLLVAVCSLRGRNGPFPESGQQDKAKYIFVGAETCASKCHNNDSMGFQYNTWRVSAHSESWKSLTTEKALSYAEKAGAGEKPWGNMVCLKCHITAAGADTSSLAPTYRKEDGVTCEACHKGEFNPKTFLPKEADCLTCHNASVHSVPSFDFAGSCLKISHPRAKTAKK
jgi:hypothetical protein